MTTRYQKSQIEDVARIIENMWLFADAHEFILSLANDFADLFAADNPPRCRVCRDALTGGQLERCTIRRFGVTEEHRFEGGFNRADFLEACGLEVKELTCPLCGKPSGDGDVHKECADYEQALADAQGESQENLEAAEALYDHKVREQEHE